MSNPDQRTELMIAKEGIQRLNQARVAVIGVGGVGGICAESLARSGIGTLILIDKDVVEASNINRQIAATSKTAGMIKVEALKERLLEIRPRMQVIAVQAYYNEDFNDELLKLHPDFVIDCIDSIKSKKDLIRFCIDHHIPELVATGTARKSDPSRLKITEVEKTSYDPIARELRSWKRKQKIQSPIQVVFSDEPPVPAKKGQPLPSMMFVPAAAGLLLASTCVQYLLSHPSNRPTSG